MRILFKVTLTLVEKENLVKITLKSLSMGKHGPYIKHSRHQLYRRMSSQVRLAFM